MLRQLATRPMLQDPLVSAKLRSVASELAAAIPQEIALLAELTDLDWFHVDSTTVPTGAEVERLEVERQARAAAERPTTAERILSSSGYAPRARRAPPPPAPAASTRERTLLRAPADPGPGVWVTASAECRPLPHSTILNSLASDLPIVGTVAVALSSKLAAASAEVRRRSAGAHARRPGQTNAPTRFFVYAPLTAPSLVGGRAGCEHRQQQ